MSHTTFYENLIASIKSTSIKVVSFDFFDTLMSRRVPNPTDAFQILAKRLIERSLFAFPVSPERFEKLRIQAEALARKEEPSIEVTIEEIYARFPDKIFKCNISEVVACELEVERELLFPVSEMLNAIHLAASRGKKIIVVSDIYFSGKQLEFLWGNSAPSVNIEFFTSSTYRAGKYSGLFPLVLKKLRVQADSVLHAGDNYVSDVKVPSANGITTCFLPHGGRAFFELINAERNHTCAEIDMGLTAIRAKASLHMSTRNIDRSNFFSYGAQILGPVLSPFVHWVNETSKESQLKVVLPLLREGHIIGQLMSELTERPHVNQTYLSRRVLFQARLVNVDRHMLTTMRFGNLDATVEEFLKLITLSRNDVPKLKAELMKSIQDDGVFNGLLDSICADKKLVSLIKQRATDIRRGILAHFLAQSTIDGELCPAVGIVDIGWNGTIQRLLQELLDEDQINVRLYGMYLMTTGTVDTLMMEGHFAKGYLIDGGVPHREFELLSRTLEIFEQSCAPAHGSVSHHDSITGDPILQPDSIPANQRADIDDIQAGILVAHRLFANNLPKDISSTKLAEIVHLLRPILLRAMLSPSAEEASLFLEWVHDDNLGSGTVMPILGSARLREMLPYMTTQQARDIPMCDLYWPSAAMAIIDEKRCRENFLLAKAAFQEKIFDRQLEGSSEFASHGCVATTSTDEEYINKTSQAVHQNRDGKTYIQYALKIDENVNLRWMPLSVPFTIKIKQISFEFKSHKGLRFQSIVEGKDLRSIAASTGIEWMDSDTWKGSGQTSAFYFYNTRALGIVGAGHLTVKIMCEINELLDHEEKINVEYPRSLDNGSQISLIPGDCVIDSINGKGIESKSAVIVNGGVSIDGWMLDSTKRQHDGEYFARFINRLGESRFVPMQGVLRKDVAENHSDELALMSGFSLTNCTLPPGDYAMSVIRKGKKSCIVSRNSWQVTIAA